MNIRNSSVRAWVAAAAALAAWTGVFMYAAWISAQLDARSSQATDTENVAGQEVAAVRLHALARDTKNQRAQLDILTRPDVIGVANIIDSIGTIAGVQLKIGGVTPESFVQKKTPASVPALHAAGFVVEADGTFSSLMHAAALLETLPALSSLQSLELEHVPLSADSGTAKTAPWHLTAHVRVITTADISS